MKFQMKTINMADKNLYYTCVVAYLAAVSFGLVIGYSSPALPQMLKTGLVFIFNSSTALYYAVLTAIIFLVAMTSVCCHFVSHCSLHSL